MISSHITSCRPPYHYMKICHKHSAPSMLCMVPAKTFQNDPYLKLKCSTSRGARRQQKLSAAASSLKPCSPVCLFGGKGKSENDNEMQASPWNALEKAMGGFKKDQSVEDLLRQQIKKQELYEGGGGDENSSGSAGGGGDGSGESEEEGLPGMLDELWQVILATIGFIFLYIYIIEGEEITVLAKDALKFIFGGQKSIRLRRTVDQWCGFFQRLTEPKEEDPYWLERAIINTATWYDSPTKYKRVLEAYARSKYYDEGDDDF